MISVEEEEEEEDNSNSSNSNNMVGEAEGEGKAEINAGIEEAEEEEEEDLRSVVNNGVFHRKFLDIDFLNSYLLLNSHQVVIRSILYPFHLARGCCLNAARTTARCA